MRSNPMSVHILQEAARSGRSPGCAVSALSAWLNTVATWTARSRQRSVLRDLAQEERLLSDIGVTREQALREADKLFWRP